MKKVLMVAVMLVSSQVFASSINNTKVYPYKVEKTSISKKEQLEINKEHYLFIAKRFENACVGAKKEYKTQCVRNYNRTLQHIKKSLGIEI